MSNEGSEAMLVWRNRFLQHGTLCEDRHHEVGRTLNGWSDHA